VSGQQTLGSLGQLGRFWRFGRRVDGAAGGLGLDLGLYAICAAFAGVTAASSTLAPHRAWGTIAVAGYLACVATVVVQLLARRFRPGLLLHGVPARAWLAAGAFGATALLPLLAQATERADGRTDRAQEEVVVIEDGARRLIEDGTPYLDRAAIAALPADERLLGYLPYQPGMAAFGLPRALDGGAGWWSDARVWFALTTIAVLVTALIVLRRAGAAPAALVRGGQAVAVVPLATLTLATGGDDVPVLALCLLALALAASGRCGTSGLAVGAAAALKLLAWPVALVLAVHAATRGRAVLGRFALAALALPVLTALPVALVNAGAMVENVVAFPFGRGLVTSPAASPLPGHLIATALPGGRTIALGLLVTAGAAVAVWLLKRPPRTAAAAALVCAAGLLVAILLMPATRFGYLLYPLSFGLWAAALRLPEPTGQASTSTAAGLASSAAADRA
jgi:hypothetical protein